VVATDWLDVLRCPRCASAPLGTSGHNLVCSACGTRVPIAGGVPCFSRPTDERERRTQRGFDLEWRRGFRTFFDEYAYDNRARFRAALGPCDPDKLRGRRFLDAGCGTGRYARVALEHGARVLGVDLSPDGLRSAQEATQSFGEQRLFIRANLLDLPLRDGAFDVVFSMGVLHHTRDMGRGFAEFVRVLRPGGWLVLGVYRFFAQVPIYRAIRRVTTRLPPGLLWCAAHLAGPIGEIPKLRRLCYPWIQWRHPWKVRVLETYDYYHPPIQEYTREEEIRAWFERSGVFTLVTQTKIGNFVGRKRC
jgi:SAM-dependent methyltransferase